MKTKEKINKLLLVASILLFIFAGYFLFLGVSTKKSLVADRDFYKSQATDMCDLFNSLSNYTNTLSSDFERYVYKQEGFELDLGRMEPFEKCPL